MRGKNNRWGGTKKKALMQNLTYKGGMKGREKKGKELQRAKSTQKTRQKISFVFLGKSSDERKLNRQNSSNLIKRKWAGDTGSEGGKGPARPELNSCEKKG